MRGVGRRGCVDKGTLPQTGQNRYGGGRRGAALPPVFRFCVLVFHTFHMHPAPSAPACLHVRAVCPWNGTNFVPAMAFSTTSRIFFGAALALAVLALAPSRASAAAHGKVFAKQADVSCGNGGAFQPAHSRRPCTLPCATVRLPSFARGGGAEPRLWLFCFCVRSHLHAHVHAHAHIQSTRMHAHACDHCGFALAASSRPGLALLARTTRPFPARSPIARPATVLSGKCTKEEKQLILCDNLKPQACADNAKRAEVIKRGGYTDLTVEKYLKWCEARCAASDKCKGFTFDRTTEQCIWRGNPACNVYTNKDRDCYSSVAVSTTTAAAAAKTTAAPSAADAAAAAAAAAAVAVACAPNGGRARRAAHVGPAQCAAARAAQIKALKAVVAFACATRARRAAHVGPAACTAAKALVAAAVAAAAKTTAAADTTAAAAVPACKNTDNMDVAKIVRGMSKSCVAKLQVLKTGGTVNKTVAQKCVRESPFGPDPLPGCKLGGIEWTSELFASVT